MTPQCLQKSKFLILLFEVIQKSSPNTPFQPNFTLLITIQINKTAVNFSYTSNQFWGGDVIYPARMTYCSSFLTVNHLLFFSVSPLLESLYSIPNSIHLHQGRANLLLFSTITQWSSCNLLIAYICCWIV